MQFDGSNTSVQLCSPLYNPILEISSLPEETLHALAASVPASCPDFWLLQVHFAPMNLPVLQSFGPNL